MHIQGKIKTKNFPLSAVSCEKIMERNCVVTKVRNLLKARNKLNKKCVIPTPLLLLRDIKGFD